MGLTFIIEKQIEPLKNRRFSEVRARDFIFETVGLYKLDANPSAKGNGLAL